MIMMSHSRNRPRTHDYNVSFTPVPDAGRLFCAFREYSSLPCHPTLWGLLPHSPIHHSFPLHPLHLLLFLPLSPNGPLLCVDDAPPNVPTGHYLEHFRQLCPIAPLLSAHNAPPNVATPLIMSNSISRCLFTLPSPHEPSLNVGDAQGNVPPAQTTSNSMVHPLPRVCVNLLHSLLPHECRMWSR